MFTSVRYGITVGFIVMLLFSATRRCRFPDINSLKIVSVSTWLPEFPIEEMPRREQSILLKTHSSCHVVVVIC